MSSHETDQMTQREALGHLVILDDVELTPFQLLSHEFRTPLTVLLAGAELLGDRFDEGEVASLAEAMGRAARRIDRLVDGMAGAFEAPGSRRVGRLGAAISGVHDELSAADRDRLVVTVSESIRCIHVPVEDVQAILHELVDNACRFSAPGLPVVIRAETRSDRVVVTVHDEGPGIAGSDRDRVFQPFRQLDMRSAREFDGLGLGLYRARKTARSLGGDVLLDEGTAGTAFHLLLPVVADVQLP